MDLAASDVDFLAAHYDDVILVSGVFDQPRPRRSPIVRFPFAAQRRVVEPATMHQVKAAHQILAHRVEEGRHPGARFPRTPNWLANADHMEEDADTLSIDPRRRPDMRARSFPSGFRLPASRVSCAGRFRSHPVLYADRGVDKAESAITTCTACRGKLQGFRSVST